MHFPRSSGILLHPTSLPSRYGIGDLGAEAYEFVDFLAASGQQIWQILPLGPTGHGNSPYMSYSSMAGNPLLISPDRLKAEGLLTDEDLAHLPDFPADRVDYNAVISTKMPLLIRAADTFRQTASEDDQSAFQFFCDRHQFWLDDFALFMALKDAHSGQSWYQWERKDPPPPDPDDDSTAEDGKKQKKVLIESLLSDLALRKPEALAHWRSQLTDAIYHQKFFQFQFFQQWTDLKIYANERQIQIFGDMPIYVAHDSADVWANPHLFEIDPMTGEPTLMAGVPPDYFSATGQLWGNPIYNWKAMERENFRWWFYRLEALLEQMDIVRIDHFRGFEAYWQVPEGEETAINGTWEKAPGTELFDAIKAKIGHLPIVAEDLGVITPEVEELRDRFEFPGMKVLHFAFGSDSGNPYLPFNFVRNSVVYTGTHDNDTTVGWYQSLNDWERYNLFRYLGNIGEEGIHWEMIRLALSSIANQAIFPLQDVLGLGTEARMNRPGQGEGNWDWRYRREMLTSELSDRLRSLTEIYGRLPQPKPTE
ncbi:MAG: 4-alpha-glucanotransferase [Synechococcales cyanobacterium T60_A2020_003]|nr:4-alpha-glucanotransferase [Synechococcales cyanobacterium T60_A2020_003]